MNRLADATVTDLITVTDLHPDDRQLIYELKITGFIVPRNTPAAINKMQYDLSKFIRTLRQGTVPHLASVVGRWRITIDGRYKPHVIYYFKS